MNFITIIKLIVKLLPTLIETIKIIEAHVTGKGKGSEKLETTRNIMEAAYEASQGETGSFEQVWPAMNKTINGLVTTFNAVGTFK